MELEEKGFLAAHNIRMLGTPASGIRMGEDREAFRAAMQRIQEPCVPSGISTSLADSLALADEIGYPVIVRRRSLWEAPAAETRQTRMSFDRSCPTAWRPAACTRS